MDKIDFVVTWVDGEDPSWKALKKKYEPDSMSGQENGTSLQASEDANDACRFRELGFLKYWFRAVEQCAPWVNKVYFVTCGQKPLWLNENHPKLRLVDHKDYMPEQYLPTFNSNPIELNLHRISDLAEHFVLFNDDMILLQPVSPGFFFKNGKPRLSCNLRYPNIAQANLINRIKFNNYVVINKHFDTQRSIRTNWKKWFDLPTLGFKRVRRNLACFLANGTIPIDTFGHVALPHLKSTMEEAWDTEYSIMNETSAHRFRDDSQINHWMLCAWNLAKGQFEPANENSIGRHFDVAPYYLPEIVNAIRGRAYPQICINDSRFNTEAERCSKEIIRAFESIYPDKSQFEK